MEKRGQQSSAQPIATLIGLIGLFMLGYILLIPPAEREALLGEEFGPGFDGTKSAENVLLDVKTGLVGEQRITVTKDLPTVNLFTTTETEVDGIVTSLSVRRNVFFNREENVTFNLINLNEVEKLELFFFVTEGEGNLIIKLNGNKIFENKVVSRLVLELPLSKLIEGNNVIEFSVSDVGAKFWGENLYVLNDLKLIKKFKVENKEAEVVFNIDEGEAESLVLANEKQCSLATDDGPSIKVCKILGISFVTAIHFLIFFYEKRLIDKDLANEKLRKLEYHGRYGYDIIKDAKSRLR